MNVRITWAIPPDILITDEFDVFYKEADPTNINNWIKANPTPLPSTTNFYDVVGLKPGTVYRFGVSKSCIGTGSFVDQISYYAIGCPIISVYQGPPVIQGLRSNPTLFYSVYYPNSTHVFGSFLNLLDFTDGNTYVYPCGTPGLNMAAPVGRTSYQTIDRCVIPQGPATFVSCNTDSLDLYPLNSSITSALGYYGLGGAASSALNYYSPICNVYGQSTDPILLEDGHEYRFSIQARIQDPAVVSLPIDLQLIEQGNVVGSCTDISGGSLSKFTPITVSADPNLISGALCYDVLTGQVNLSVKDGTNQIYLPSLGFSYTTEDSLGNALPLVNSGSIVINTSDVTYTVYCPVEMDPSLDPSQLSSGMTVDVFLNDPSPNNICTITNANYTGQTFLQVCNNIASYITSNTPYTADAVTIAGVIYIRISVTGINVVSAQINISGPAILGPVLPDILQVAPTLSPGTYRIQDAFIYDSGSGDKIYGTRGFVGNDTGKIEVSDITTASTLEYNHPIAIQTSRLALVDVPPPLTAWNINVSDAAGVGIGGINQDIVKTPAVWNTGYIYRLFYDGSTTEIRVTDSAGAFIDSERLFNISGNAECARLISVDQTSGTQLVVMVDDPSTPGQCTAEIIQHGSLGSWASVNVLSIPSSNEIIKGTVTGVVPEFTVQSSTQYSITVAGTPWTLNQYNRWTVEITTGVYAGTKVRLYNYCLAPTCNPPLTNISNDTNTLYIDPAASFGFDASLLTPGDKFVLLNSYAAFNSFYDIGASYASNIYLNYNITFEDPTNPTFGNEFFINSNGAEIVSFTTKSSGSYFSKVPDNTTITTNLTYNTPYRIYKINDGDIVFNSTNGYWYHSCGNGQVNVIDSGTGNLVGTEQLLEPDSVTFANGAFQIAIDAAGEAYCIQRDSTNTDVGITLTPITSKNIYRIDSTGLTVAAIDGSLLWNENIAGNISVYDDGVNEYLFFTSIQTRKVYKYHIAANTFTTKTVPSVYKKSASVEKIQGAVHVANDRMVIMNKLNALNTNLISNDYLFTNLFVYDFATNTIEQVLVGANSTPYSGATASWNTGGYGEMFGEWCGNKDYGRGGLSIKVDGNRIFWRQWMTDKHYQSQSFAETGVAQMWGICVGEQGGLIKIWNIQSNGSLLPSNRTLYYYPSVRSLMDSPVKLMYDTFYSHVIGVTFQSQTLVLIDPTNFTGYHGGPYYGNYTSFDHKLAINTLDAAPANIVFPTDFITNNQGDITIIGPKNGTINTQYLRYTNSDITGSSNTYTLTGQLSDSTTSNTGLFYAGYTPGYSQVYDPVNNQIWLMARDRPDFCENPPCPPNALTPQDQVIGILDHDTMTVVDVLNLANNNATIIGSVGFYYLGFYVPGFNAICYIGAIGNKMLLIDISSKQIVYNGTFITPANFLRPSPLFGGYYAWMVPYNNGIFLDYTNSTATDERWIYITPQTVTYTGLVHNLLNVIYNNTTTIITDDVFATTITADTFGQWKIADALPLPGDDVVYWNNISGGGTITMVTNETLELTQFSMENPIVSVENITQSVLYEITNPTYVNVNTLPTFNTLNSIPFFAIKADNVNLFNNDILQITFANPVYPSCPFITTVTINF